MKTSQIKQASHALAGLMYVTQKRSEIVNAVASKKGVCLLLEFAPPNHQVQAFTVTLFPFQVDEVKAFIGRLLDDIEKNHTNTLGILGVEIDGTTQE